MFNIFCLVVSCVMVLVCLAMILWDEYGPRIIDWLNSLGSVQDDGEWL